MIEATGCLAATASVVNDHDNAPISLDDAEAMAARNPYVASIRVYEALTN
jgi:hypothetical protein